MRKILPFHLGSGRDKKEKKIIELVTSLKNTYTKNHIHTFVSIFHIINTFHFLTRHQCLYALSSRALIISERNMESLANLFFIPTLASPMKKMI